MMDEEDFKKMCPNLFGAIKDNQYIDEIYGIKFKTHTALTRHQIIEATEDRRAFLWGDSKMINEIIFMVLN